MDQAFGLRLAGFLFALFMLVVWLSFSYRSFAGGARSQGWVLLVLAVVALGGLLTLGGLILGEVFSPIAEIGLAP